MKDELTKVHQEIAQLILSDPFVARIEPEVLQLATLAYPERLGKALRPALLMWSCGLYAEPRPQALRLAAAVELYHTWTLVHDDIIDNDDTRRGGPSVHALVRKWAYRRFGPRVADAAKGFGRNMAILAGDVMHAWSSALVLDSIQDGVRPAVATKILHRMHSELTPALIGGEAIDVEFELRSLGHITSDEIIKMLTLKTGRLVQFAAESGAMVGLDCDDPNDERVQAVGQMAAAAGLAFQLQDDLLGMYADEATLGKPVGSDLRQGKATLLFAEGLKALNDEQYEHFYTCFGGSMVSDEEVAKVGHALRESGATETVEKRANELLQKADEAAETLPDNPYRTLLKGWLDYVRNRNL